MLNEERASTTMHLCFKKLNSFQDFVTTKAFVGRRGKQEPLIHCAAMTCLLVQPTKQGSQGIPRENMPGEKKKRNWENCEEKK